MVALNKESHYEYYLPLEHQTEAINNGVRHFSVQRNGKLIMPCGSGKTLTALWIADELKCKSVVVVIPTLQLQSQTLKSWIKDVSADKTAHEIILIGSDNEIGDAFDVTSSTDELKIRNQILSDTGANKIVFTTYQSSHILSKIAIENNVVFDLVIFDEAHHTTGFEKGMFQSLMQLPETLVKKRLFMTATPRVLRDSGRGDGEQADFFSMDDESVYGSEFYRLRTSVAVEKGIISPYKIVTLNTNLSEVRDLLTHNEILNDPNIEGLSVSESRMIAAAVAIVKIIRLKNLRHLIAFTSTISRSKQFQAVLRSVAKVMFHEIDVFQIDNTYSEKERVNIISDFMQADCSVITNARLLGEGFDMPAVDAVVFIDERESVIEIVQYAGRAWRISKGKKVGYILLPIALDSSNISSPEYEFIRHVFASLAANDDLVMDYFRRSNSSGRENSKIIEFEGIPVNFDLLQFTESLRLSVWKSVEFLERKEKGWMDYPAFVDFVKNYLHPIGVNSQKQYKLWRSGKLKGVLKRPINVPSNPWSKYKGEYRAADVFILPYKEWASWNELKKYIKTHLIPFGVRTLKDYSKWAYGKAKYPGAPVRPQNIPRSLRSAYHQEFNPVELWGENYRSPSVSAEEFEKFVKVNLLPNGINSLSKYRKWALGKNVFVGAPGRPSNVPKTPEFVYRGKINFEDLFPGFMVHGKDFIAYNDFVIYVKKNLVPRGVNTITKYRLWSAGKIVSPDLYARPKNIPANPEKVYSEYNPREIFPVFGFKNFVAYDEFKRFVKEILFPVGVCKVSDYKLWSSGGRPDISSRPKNIPAAPWLAYKGEYKGSEVFLSRERKGERFLELNEFKDFVKQNLLPFGVNNLHKYYLWASGKFTVPGLMARPENIPSNLHDIYKGFRSQEIFIQNEQDPDLT